MARRPRLHVVGGFYHVTLRGNHRQLIFRSDDDRDVLDGIVAKVTCELDASVHAYCWMTNHLHAVVRVGEPPLGRIMQRIATRYARHFQKALGTTGHLFERRYHAVLVAGDSQLLATVRYVHLNPVRAGLVEDPAGYRWSGHRGYLGLGGPAWLRTTFVLNLLHENAERARASYAEWLAEELPGVSGDPCPPPPAATSAPKAGGQAMRRPESASRQAAGNRRFDDLIAEICAEERVAESALRSRSRDRRLAAIRTRIATEAIQSGVSSLSEVARRFDRHITSVSKAMTRRQKVNPNT
jgi:REP element-mobilizing transposase RayT